MGIAASVKGYIAVNTLSDKLLLINKNNNSPETVLKLPGIVRTSKFSPDGSALYVYTLDGKLTIVNPEGNDTLSRNIKFKLEDIAVSNSHIYGLTPGGDVVIWDRNKTTLADPVIIPSSNDNISIRGTAISCTPDDSLIIWGNENGQVFYLKNGLEKKAQYLTKFSGPVTGIAFNNSYNLVAVASYDKTIQVFTLPHLQSDVPLILDNNNRPVTSLLFQKDKEGKENLIVVMSPGTIRIYPMDMQTLACRIYQLYKDKPPSNEDLDMYIDNAAKYNKEEIKCNE